MKHEQTPIILKHEQTPIILYISLDGGYSYRQNHLTEEAFKRKLWETACRWLRPDSEMCVGGYGVQIIVRYSDLTFAGIIHVAGGRGLDDLWNDITDLWEKIKKES